MFARFYRIVRKHAYQEWVATGGDREALGDTIHAVAKRVKQEVGFGILGILVSILSIIQFLTWLYDRWKLRPPTECDLDDVEAMAACGIAIHLSEPGSAAATSAVAS